MTASGERPSAQTSVAAAVRRVGGRVGTHAGVWSLTLVLGLVAATILAPGVAAAPSPLAIPIPTAALVAVLYLLAERFPVHLRVRRETHTFSVTEIPLVVGLFFMTPLAIVLAQALGAGVALVVHRRQRVMKLAFNLANFACSTAGAAWVFHLVLGSQDPHGPTGLVAAYAAAVTADQVSGLGVALAIWLSGGPRPDVREHVGIATVYTFVDASLALVAVIVLTAQPDRLWLLAVPVVTTVVGFRLYQDERLKRESLGSLQESTRVLQDVFDTENVSNVLLRQVRDMFSVRVAALVVFRGGPMHPGIATLDIDGVFSSMDGTVVDGLPELATLVGSEAGARIVDGSKTEASLPWMRGNAPEGAMVAPLRDGDAVRGLLVAAGRLTNAGPFHPVDVSLFETLANHAAVAMKNSYLVDRLRAEARQTAHQAAHDMLTGLPNRTLFRDRLDAALRGGDGRCAVLLLDVDRFKEVNDTLGHHNGDRLLQAMAARLTGSVADAGLVARLSGDEYAVLVTWRIGDPGSVEERAVAVARTIASDLSLPFEVEGLALVMSASIGIAVSPEHGQTSDVLIRRADVAMYNAKRDHGGFEIYRPERDEYSAARLALVADLRAAVEADQIEVAYQLQVDAATGGVTGAEALVRWRHPVRGVIMPLAFVDLAEHAGLIRPLTERVLWIAVRDAVVWRRRWPELTVAVNLSPRLLLDTTLTPLVRRVLAEHGLPPSALTIEVTESAILDSTSRVEDALRDLTSLGCGISIDDFGTGYSSFSYLRRLSIDELKVDRSFVQGMATDESDRAIVELTIDLGHRLGKRVVAEGVETDLQAEHLTRLGCDVLQGYLLSRPITHEAFMEAVESRARATGWVRDGRAAADGWSRITSASNLRRMGSVSYVGPPAHESRRPRRGPPRPSESSADEGRAGRPTAP